MNLQTSHIKSLAGRLENAHPREPIAREAAEALKALAVARDELQRLAQTQADIIARISR